MGRFIKDVSASADVLGLDKSIDEDIYKQKYVFEVAWEVVNKGTYLSYFILSILNHLRVVKLPNDFG